ncbi:MAG: serine protease [Phycisphaerae bacterium]
MPAEKADGPVDGRAVLTGFTRQLVRILRRKQAAPLSELRGQLKDDMHHAMKLPEPSKTPKTPRALYETCRRSVLLVGKIYKCDKCDRWHTSTASGFVLHRDGVIVTNYHVLAEDERGQAIAARTWDGRFLEIRKVLASSKVNDLVVLQTDGDGLVPLPVAQQPPIGTEVFVISHPVSHLYTMTGGIVSGDFLRRAAGKGKTYREMAITADFAKGSSGAPVLDRTGAVVGIVRATRPVYYEKKDGIGTSVQMVWKFCIPSASLLQMLREPAHGAGS